MLAAVFATVLAAPLVPGPGTPSDLLTAWRPGVQDPMAVGLTTLVGWTHPSSPTAAVGARFGLSERFAVATSLSAGPASRWTLAAPATVAVGVVDVGVVPLVDVSFSEGPALGVVGALAVGNGPVSLVLNVGGTTSRALLGSIAASLAASDDLSVHVEASSRVPVDLDSAPTELLTHVRYRVAYRLFVDVGGALTAGVDPTAYRVFGGVTLRLGGRPDRDHDGVIDQVDACIDHPETVNGYLDDDGCPDNLGSVAFTVRDPDGSPLAGVPVVLGDRAPKRTDYRGRAVFNDLIPDDLAPYAIRPEEPLYVGVTGELVPHDEATVYQHTLAWAPWVVRAHVVDAAGTPVPAEVSWFGPEGATGTFAAANGEGLVALGPGTYRFTAVVDGFSLGDGTVETRADGVTPLTLTVVEE